MLMLDLFANVYVCLIVCASNVLKHCLRQTIEQHMKHGDLSLGARPPANKQAINTSNTSVRAHTRCIQ